MYKSQANEGARHTILIDWHSPQDSAVLLHFCGRNKFNVLVSVLSQNSIFLSYFLLLNPFAVLSLALFLFLASRLRAAGLHVFFVAGTSFFASEY